MLQREGARAEAHLATVGGPPATLHPLVARPSSPQ
jgi:hypothetical protein